MSTIESQATRGRLGAAALTAGAIAFAFRLITVRSLTDDHYMHLAWAQQLLLGQWPGRDFVDPGMPLMYSLSAVVQWFAPGPFSEALITCALLAIAASVTVIVTAELTGSVAAGTLAALFEIAMTPRLYSYPKILVPVIALLLIARHVRKPTRGTLALLALWTAVATLLRHDLGVYAAAGITTALALPLAKPRRVVRPLVEYAVALVVMMVPYVVYVQWSEGLPAHFHNAIEFAKGEAHQRFLAPPAFPFWSDSRGLAAWNAADCAVFLFYVANLLPVVATALLATARTERRERTPAMAAAITMLVLYLVVVLRHPIATRIQDLASLLAIAGTWTVVASGRRALGGAPAAARAARLAFAAIALAAAGSVAATWTLNDVSDRVAETRVMDGLDLVDRTIEGVKESGTVWPWERFWPAGELPEAIRYLNACTAPTDKVLLTWPAPQYYYFARRPFGAGQALFLPPDAFTNREDQELMLARMMRERIPIILVNETRAQEFADAYGAVQGYLRQEYVASGHFQIREGSDVTIAVRRDLKPEGTYGSERWPCGFESRAASRTASIMLDGSAVPLPAMSNAVP